MARVKVCRLCGEHNGPDELFCGGCGTSLADVAAMDESEIARLAAAAAAEEELAGDAPDAEPQATPEAIGHTTREQQAAHCALVFPWGRMPVAGQLGIGREAGFSPISQQLDAYPTVSRQHAVVALAQGRWTVRDLRSTNGTYVNGARLAAGETRTIGNGDQVGFSRGLQVEVEIGAEAGTGGR